MGAISDADSDTASVQKPFQKKQYRITSKTSKIIVTFLCFINFLNYVDRYTLISVLGKVKDELNISATQQGLVATIFIVAYMLASPIAGYYGDKHSRKLLIIIGVLVWTTSIILAFLIPEYHPESDKKTLTQTAEQQKTFYMLLGTRVIFGVGEAAYMAVAPGIIHDIYCDESSRTLALTIFNGMIPIGGGFGYMLPSLLPTGMRTWRNSMACTVPFTLVVLLFFFFKFKDIPHGYSDLINQAGNQNKLKKFKSPPWTDTLKGFLQNSTYKFTVLGFTCVCYIMGAGSTFLPQLYKYSGQMQAKDSADLKKEDLETNYASMKLLFGGITMVSGIAGCYLGSILSDKWRKMHNPRSDSDVCAIGMLFGSLCMYVSLLTSGTRTNLSLALYFFGATGVNFNWALTVKMVMDVVRPNEKSTANAFLTLIAHAFGDAFSPVLVGYCADMLADYLLSNDDQFKGLTKNDAKVQYHSLQQPLMSMALIAGLGAIFFFLASIYIVDDSKSKLHQELEQSESDADEVPNAHQTTPFSDSGHETDNLTRVIYRKPSMETMRMSVGNS